MTPIPYFSADRQHLAFDAAVQDRIGRLLGAEARQPRRSATHCASTISEAGKVEDPMARTLPARIRSVSAERVSSMSVSGEGR